MSYPVEALLRPIVEYPVCLISTVCASAAFYAPHQMMMAPSVGTGTGVALSLYAAYWGCKGWKIHSYQRGLGKNRTYEVKTSSISMKPEFQMVGKGFRWQERHTQRLHDTRLSRHIPFVPEYEDGTGNPFLHGVEPKERDIYMPIADRRGHTLIAGTTGAGKTRAAEILITQDIRRGSPVIVFDPKGDADLLSVIRNSCVDAGRENDFMLFHLGYPDISCRYNGIGQFHRMTEVASRITGQVPGEGNSAIFREFGWRFCNIVARAIIALNQIPDYKSMLRHINDIDSFFVQYCEFLFAENEDIKETVSKGKVDPKLLPRNMQGRPDEVILWDKATLGKGDETLEGLRSVLKYERMHFDKIIASVLPLLEKLTSGKVAELLSPDYMNTQDKRPILDWRQVANQNKVVYVGLDALSDAAVSAAVGNSMFADLVSYAGSRYKHGDSHGLRTSSEHKPIILYLDEFSELMGDEFVPMANKAGAAGLHITAMTQNYADIEANANKGAQARQVRGNFNNIIMFRVKEEETAEMLTKRLPEVTINDMTIIDGASSNSDINSEVEFTSRHEDRVTVSRVPMLQVNDVMSLQTGQAFALINGNRLYKLRMPLAKVERTSDYNQSFHSLVNDMRRQYRTGENWWAA